MAYMSKNYFTDGGDTLVIGGKLKFEDDVQLDGFPKVENLSSSATVAQLIQAMKVAKLMTGDSFTLGVASCTPPVANTAANSAAATISYANGIITVSIPSVEGLEDSDHGETWGVHKWIGFGVSTGLSSLVGLKFDDHTAKVTLSAADEAEAQSVGLNSDGQFVLYIKAEKIFAAGGQTFVLSYDGYEDAVVTIKVVEI